MNAVRHYHKVGLLDEPERDTNGYKHYGVAHLQRLLRIRRLSDLGVSLPGIAALGDADEHPDEALEVLDAELSATIERLQSSRADLAVMRARRLPTDLPPELGDAIRPDLSEADRALMVVYGRVLDADGIEAMQEILTEHDVAPIDAEFDNLPASADEDTRHDLAVRFLPHIIEVLAQHPNLLAAQRNAPGGFLHMRETIHLAMTDVYNPAQLDVLERVGREMRVYQARHDTT